MSLPPPPVLACPAVPSTRRGAAVRRCSLLLVSSDHAPLQTLHMNVWGPASIRGTDQIKANVDGVLIPWIRATRRQLRMRFWRDLPVCNLTGAVRSLPASLRSSVETRASPSQTLPTLRLTGDVGDASAFRVWGTLSLVHDTTASYLFPRTLCCIFLGFLTNNPPWQFYQPASRRLMSSQDVTFAGSCSL
ncbi:unnamed protein product, partial [Closterium sp. NIES-54]